jgi:hypothetical protein
MAGEGLGETTLLPFRVRCERNWFPHKFAVEKRRTTPYGNRSYLPGGAALGNRGAKRQANPPCSRRRKTARNMLLI